ncbi:hypothetical protein RSAG8_03750, partial [Rhizoctonia solani AG-8 WAC10335]
MHLTLQSYFHGLDRACLGATGGLLFYTPQLNAQTTCHVHVS